jgi:lipid-binding SYLF domain-containing protein
MPKLTKGQFAFALLASSLFAFVCAQARSSDSKKANEELTRATETVQNLTSAPADKGVPKDVLQGATCLAVIPKLAKGAFVVGGEHGAGVATCLRRMETGVRRLRFRFPALAGDHKSAVRART